MNFSDKKQIRKDIKTVLQNKKDNFNDWSIKICQKILNTDEYKNCTCLLAYMALPDEVDLSLVIEQAAKDGKDVYIPRVDPDSSNMEFYKYDSEQYSKGAFGILEPIGVCPPFNFNRGLSPGKPTGLSSGKPTGLFPNAHSPVIPLVLVPGRAFTKDGSRLGRGKGYYDNYLSKLLNKKGDSAISKTTFMGICFNCQLLPEIPVEAHDIKMDLVISEE